MRFPKVVWVILILAILVLLVFLASLWLAGYVMTGRRQTLDEAMQWQSEHYDTGFYENLEKENYTVDSYDGYTLHVQLLKNPETTTKYMLFSAR